MIKIPDTFECAGYEWKVRLVPKLRKKEGADGMTLWRKHEVHLHADLEPAEMHHAFLHELTHVVLEAMGLHRFNKQRHDYQVDAFAGLLHQILKSAHGSVELD